jgi:DNA polymerase-3 subunit chi
MAIISFYQALPGNQEKASCQLLEKCYKGNYKVLVRLSNEELQESLNKSLWTFAQKAFVPHGSKNDPLAEVQPIYITTGTENPNGANVLMLVGTIEGVYEQFERVFVVFDDLQGALISNIKGAMEKLQIESNQVSYYKQNAKGGWDIDKK